MRETQCASCYILLNAKEQWNGERGQEVWEGCWKLRRVVREALTERWLLREDLKEGRDQPQGQVDGWKWVGIPGREEWVQKLWDGNTTRLFQETARMKWKKQRGGKLKTKSDGNGGLDHVIPCRSQQWLWLLLWMNWERMAWPEYIW